MCSCLDNCVGVMATSTAIQSKKKGVNNILTRDGVCVGSKILERKTDDASTRKVKSALLKLQ